MTEEDSKLTAALDLMRRLPPSATEKNLSFLVALAPEISEDILSNIDAPLKVELCEKTNKNFLLCDFNRDGDSYRSPWSNEYQPALEDGVMPNERMRTMELRANELFAEYFKQYYDRTCISSCYFWQEEDVEDEFSGYILVKKESKGERGVEQGVWDAIHVITAKNSDDNESVTYTLISTILLSLNMKDTNTDLSGSVQKQETNTVPKVASDEQHLVHIGEMIQSVENYLWDSLDRVYFNKTVEITSNLRSTQASAFRNSQSLLIGELMKFKK